MGLRRGRCNMHVFAHFSQPASLGAKCEASHSNIILWQAYSSESHVPGGEVSLFSLFPGIFVRKYLLNAEEAQWTF
jgi:hypothetical protein